MPFTNNWCINFNFNRGRLELLSPCRTYHWGDNHHQSHSHDCSKSRALRWASIPSTTSDRLCEPALRSTGGPLKRSDWCLEHLNWQLAWSSAKRSLHTDRMNLTLLFRTARSWELHWRLRRKHLEIGVLSWVLILSWGFFIVWEWAVSLTFRRHFILPGPTLGRLDRSDAIGPRTYGSPALMAELK
jgi:hypothetical protein